MRRALTFVAVLALVAGACGEDDVSLEVSDAWSRPSTGPNGAVYLTIDGGDADTALTSVTVGGEVAAMAQIHETVMGDDGTMGMTALSEVEIPAGETVVMAPGGIHVMLMELAEPLELGDEIEVTLFFGNGTERTVMAEVRDE